MPRTRANRALYPIAEHYQRAVEKDVTVAHPIQLASDCLPESLVAKGFVSVAKALYDYSVCVFDVSGTPLMPSDPIGVAHWIIFENVYVRGDHGCFPTNADRDKARRAGFEEKPGPNDQRRARDLWAATVREWGPPVGSF
jgi:hypothetical protein